MVIKQRCHNIVKVTLLLQHCHNIGLQCCHNVVKLRNLGMCPSRDDNVKTDLTKIQPVDNVVVT